MRLGSAWEQVDRENIGTVKNFNKEERKNLHNERITI
jgi:hypothetical protein